MCDNLSMLWNLYLPDSKDVTVSSPCDVPSHKGEGGSTTAGKKGVVVPDVGHLPHPVWVQLQDTVDRHKGSMVQQALGGSMRVYIVQDGCVTAISINFSNSRSKQ